MTDVREWFPEFKVAAESDTDLQKYFLKTRYLDEIFKSKKWLVLGRKGTGKTAIYEYLRNCKPASLDGAFPLCLNFKDYPWPVHKLYKESMEGELSAYQKSWHYLFVVQSLSKLISIKKASSLPISKDLEQAGKVINEIYGSPFPSLLEVIKSKIARVDTVSLPSAEMGEINFSAGELSFEEISENASLKLKLRTNSFTLLSYFEKVLLSNSGGTKILICLDQLDENWLSAELEEYSKILINLISICGNLNNSSKYKDVFRVLVFLRADIYNTLRFNDKNKIFQDNAVEIRWDAASLDEMFFERIKANKPESMQLNFESQSNCLFEGKHVRHGATPLKHMLRRTFYRPRDVIVFYNKVREIHVPTKSGLYNSKDLYGAEKNYSLSMYNELIDEWSNQKPEIEQYLAVLQNIGYQTFSFSDFENKYKLLFPGSDKNSVAEALRFMFLNSIVGQKISANWEYYCVNVHMQVELDKPFHVNNGLKNRLMLTENRNKKAKAKKKLGSQKKSARKKKK